MKSGYFTRAKIILKFSRNLSVTDCQELGLPRRHEIETPPPKYFETQDINPEMSLSVHLFPPPPDYREALNLSAK